MKVIIVTQGNRTEIELESRRKVYIYQVGEKILLQTDNKVCELTPQSKFTYYYEDGKNGGYIVVIKLPKQRAEQLLEQLQKIGVSPVINRYFHNIHLIFVLKNEKEKDKILATINLLLL